MATRLVVDCEPDEDAAFHAEALAAQFPEAGVCDLPAGEELPAPESLEFAVISGSTAGVYEDRAWIDDGRRFVRALADSEIPTLAVCFGHQLVNDALGGRVRQGEFRAGLVRARLDETPLFEGVSTVVPVIHGDFVVEAGASLSPIASALDYEYPIFGTRHETAPIWTVQFHPEIGQQHRPELAKFGWDEHGYDFGAVTAERVFENFRRLA